MNDDQNDVFDVDRVRSLIELMIEHGLSEVDLRQHGQTIRLRRGGETVQTMVAPPQVAAAPAAAPATAATEAADEDAGLVVIKSPMVGTLCGTQSHVAHYGADDNIVF